MTHGLLSSGSRSLVPPCVPSDAARRTRTEIGGGGGGECPGPNGVRGRGSWLVIESEVIQAIACRWPGSTWSGALKGSLWDWRGLLLVAGGGRRADSTAERQVSALRQCPTPSRADHELMGRCGVGRRAGGGDGSRAPSVVPPNRYPRAAAADKIDGRRAGRPDRWLRGRRRREGGGEGGEATAGRGASMGQENTPGVSGTGRRARSFLHWGRGRRLNQRRGDWKRGGVDDPHRPRRRTSTTEIKQRTAALSGQRLK